MTEEEKQPHVPSFIAPTLNQKGERKWLYPERRKIGKWINVRRQLAVVLMMIYLIVPWLQIHELPLFRFDGDAQRIYLFGSVLRFNEINLLLFFIVGGGFLLFLVTALWGRLWCGVACPQTVFLDWLIRPIEELCEGGFARRKSNDAKKPKSLNYWMRKILKHILFLLIAWVIANTFLGYFVDPSVLISWMTSSPFEHPRGFLVMAFVWIVFYLDFAWFREQFCSFLCPYARFQSLLIDDKTPVVSFDSSRGNPRGKRASGDCIDCEFCVRVCPTGIDIRNGLQLECIQCFRCVDACDEIMTNLKRPLGLIRHVSQHELISRSSLSWKSSLRPRVVFYFLGSLVTCGFFLWHFMHRPPLRLTLTRPIGALESTLPDGRKGNLLQVRVINNTSTEQSLSLEIMQPQGGEIICGPCQEEKLKPLEDKKFVLLVVFSEKKKDEKIVLKHSVYSNLIWEISTAN